MVNLESFVIVCGVSAGAACLYLWLWSFRVVNSGVGASSSRMLARTGRLHSYLGVALSLALVASSCFLALNNRKSIEEARREADHASRQLVRAQALVHQFQDTLDAQGALLEDTARIVDKLETRLLAATAGDRVTVLDELTSLKRRIHEQTDYAGDAPP